VSEDGDSDVRVEVAGHVWTFNAACFMRLPPPTNATEKKLSPETSNEGSSDNDDDDDDDEQLTIGLFFVCLFVCLFQISVAVFIVDFLNIICSS